MAGDDSGVGPPGLWMIFHWQVPRPDGRGYYLSALRASNAQQQEPPV
jgi:hypothetical protein